MAEGVSEPLFEPTVGPSSGPVSARATETPCDPLPTVRDERRGRRSRFAVGLGVGLVGAASLTTAVYQTITQSSTTVGLPGEVAEIDTPLPWAAGATPAGLPASSAPITPTVADLDLRADQQPLPAVPGPVAPVAPPAAAFVVPVGTPGPPPIVADAEPRFTPPAPRDRPAPSSGTSGGRPSGTTTPSTGSSTPPTDAPSSETPSSETPSSDTSSSETPSSEAPSSGTPTPAPASGSGTAEPSTAADGG